MDDINFYDIGIEYSASNYKIDGPVYSRIVSLTGRFAPSTIECIDSSIRS